VVVIVDAVASMVGTFVAVLVEGKAAGRPVDRVVVAGRTRFRRGQQPS
jgi:hypothetical protein